MALVTAIAALVLGLIFVFAASIILKDWGLQSTDATIAVARRLGAVYLGIATLLFLSTTNMPATQAISIGLTVAMGLLAVLGVYELQAGLVRKTIIGSVVIEALLALAFLSTLLKFK